MTSDLTKTEKKLVDRLLCVYEAHYAQVELFRNQLLIALSSSIELTKAIHSIRSRSKDPTHLKDKLIRKLQECKRKKTPFDISPDNLLVRINDLVGVRVLHLYTRQIQNIDPAIREVFQENKYDLLEGPFARTWDDESRQLFKDCGIETQESPSMYTSVHYVVGSASKTKMSAEIQVRTLMEEVWGEVDHTMNYPHPIGSLACREQLKVLARVTSSASRLVDSIFATVDDHNNSKSAGVAVKAVSGKRRNR